MGCDKGFNFTENKGCFKIDPCEIIKCPSKSRCDEGKCVCPSDYKFDKEKGCIKEVLCKKKCPENSKCIDGECICDKGFKFAEEKGCILKDLPSSECTGEENFDEMEVSCTPSGLEITVPICAFVNAGVDHESVHLTDKMTYKNFINGISGNKHGGVTRQRALTVEFSCSLNLDKTISMSNGIKPMMSKIEVKTENQESSFEVS